MKFSFGNKTEIHWVCKIGGIIILAAGIYWRAPLVIVCSSFTLFVGWTGFKTDKYDKEIGNGSKGLQD